MRHIRIVTDSTADIPDDLIAALEIEVIPDYINFGTTSLRDRVDISRAEFYDRLQTVSQLPTTASPSVGEFEEAFRRAGAPDIQVVSLHPPSQFSALYNTALLAARSFPEGRVTVVDCGQITMGLGWLVIAAARAAQAGEPVERIVERVKAMMPRVRVFAALDTVEFLRRSGRVSWVRSIVATLLRVKPMLEVQEGQILPLERVRTGRRAMERLIELTHGLAPVDSLAVLHSNWLEGADQLRSHLEHLDTRERILTVDVTPVIGVHVGPRGIGVAVMRAEDE